MKLGVLFSGGKDSCYSAYIAKKQGNELACLITIHSENKNSYMFHTPSIKKTEAQAKVMGIPLMVFKTKGEKEKELKDLEKAIKEAIKKYKIEGVISGAIASRYQYDRIGKICEKLKIESFTPIWQNDELEYLNELIKNKFKIIITGVAAYPLDEKWLGKEINRDFVDKAVDLNNKHKIHIAGEGGEFETFVLDCPLFKKPLKVKKSKITGEKNSWRLEIDVE
ncbi:diphthine--ammonia ligase [Candidatus Pacearchaeota archaeon]|nr:diphthine--ammonia ligase [Candidatus Pacearchaeota archaeon]